MPIINSYNNEYILNPIQDIEIKSDLTDDEYAELISNLDANQNKISEPQNSTRDLMKIINKVSEPQNSTRDLIKIINNKKFSLNIIENILSSRKDVHENILGVLLKNYHEEISLQSVKKLYKKEVNLKFENFLEIHESIYNENNKYNVIDYTYESSSKYETSVDVEKRKSYENLLSLAIGYGLITRDAFKEENDKLIESINNLKNTEEKKELIKKILNVEYFNKEQIINIFNKLGNEIKEETYQSNVLQLILTQKSEDQDELISEYLKNNLDSDTLNNRLLVLQKNENINLKIEIQEEIIESQLKNKKSEEWIDLIFDFNEENESISNFFKKNKINVKIQQRVIEHYIDSQNVNTSGLMNIISNYKNIKGLELSKEIKEKIKFKLNQESFGEFKYEVKDVFKKMKLMCQFLYLDEYYVSKENKKEIIKKIISAKDWVVWEKESWTYQEELTTDILKDLVVYHINNNKDFLKDFLKIENKIVKGLIAERIINEVIDNKYQFNKVGKEIIKESIDFLAREASPRLPNEEILFNHILNIDDKKEKTISLILDYMDVNKRCYLDLLSLNESKKIEKTISELFSYAQVFIQELNKESLLEYINEEKLDAKLIEIVIDALSKEDLYFEEIFLNLKDKYRNNIEIVNSLLKISIGDWAKISLKNKEYENSPTKGAWNYIGDEIKEKLELTLGNVEEKISKFNTKNTKGVFGYVTRRNKEKFQEAINKECDKREKEKWDIDNWLKRSEDIKKYLNKDELISFSNLENEVKEINELGKENISQYNMQEIKKDCEIILKIMGADNFMNKIEETNVKIIKMQEEMKENLKMELKKEVAVIRYRM